MTSEEKANELIGKFAAHSAGSTGDQNWINAKNCAIISVDLILKLPSMDDGRMMTVIKEDYQYWQEVKNHLNQM